MRLITHLKCAIILGVCKKSGLLHSENGRLAAFLLHHLAHETAAILS
nr:MAG TPA: hypothetical protein [Caudoviricetes sp.]